MSKGTTTMVRKYKSFSKYQRDAARLSKQGWRVVNATQEQPRTGCLRGCLLGLLFALVFKPMPAWVVTYELKSESGE